VKINAINMMRRAAIELRRSNPMLAYGLLEMANNLRLVMRGDETIEDWNRVYVGADREPIDIDAILPPVAVDH